MFTQSYRPLFKHAQLESVKASLVAAATQALPLHVRLQRALRQLILDGTLAVGKPLPATRALATSLGVSRDTVESAYGQLHLEGFIERHVGRGSFVSPRAEHLPHRPAGARPQRVTRAQALSRRGAAIVQRGGVLIPTAVRPFAQGLPETRTFPLATWERLQRQVLKEHGSGALTSAPAQGLAMLRQAIADYVSLERGAHASADQVLVLTSSQQALTLCATVLFDAGDAICVEDPGYYGARKAFEATGLTCVPLPVDAEGLCVNRLPEPGACSGAPQPRGLYPTPSHQFPTGATLALDRRLAVIAWAHRHHGWILEDDYDSEFHYAGRPTACVQGLDPHGRTIYIGTFTKSLFPGLRIGYMVLPPELVAPMTAARTLLDGHSAPIPQLTLARFLQDGHFGAHVRAMRLLYAQRRDILAHLIRTHLSGILEPRIPTGGMQMPCLFVCDMDEAEAVRAARRAGVDVLGLSTLHAGQTPAQGLLLGFAAHAPHEMAAGIEALASALHEQVRRRLA